MQNQEINATAKAAQDQVAHSVPHETLSQTPVVLLDGEVRILLYPDVASARVASLRRTQEFLSTIGGV